MFHFKKKIFGITVEISVLPRKVVKADDTLVRYLKLKISGMERSLCLYKGRSYAGNSISNYKKLLRLWPYFEKYAGMHDIRISEISMDTYFSFMEFCDHSHYMDSTKYQYAALLKSVMNCALEDGVSANNVQNSRGFVTRRMSSVFKKVYLAKEEIDRLAALKLKSGSALEKVRDVFLAGCWTGQRFSDYSGISTQELESMTIDGTEYKAFRIVQKKTGRMVLIPVLDRRLPDILKKWGGSLPKVSVSMLNSRIKVLCRMAGIDTPTVVHVVRGGTKVKEVRPKYELVSSHTARRSCITNLYLDGRLTQSQIRCISGHADEGSFKRYLCQSNEDEIRGIIRQMAATVTRGNCDSVCAGHNGDRYCY